MAKKKDLVVKKGTAVATQGQAPRGIEDWHDPKEDLIMPRAKLLQSNSPEIVDGVKGLKNGMIINSLTKEELPEIFIPIFMFNNWIRFNPRDKKDENYCPDFAPGAVIWKSNDPFDAKVEKESKFGPNGEKPVATRFMNFLSFFPSHDMPVVISFCNTSFKAGKKLLTLIKFSRQDAFAKMYRLKSLPKENDLGKFNILDVEIAGDALDTDYKVAEAWYNSFKPRQKDIDIHDQDDTGV